MQSNRDVRKTGRGGWPLAAAAIGAFLFAGTTAAPAQAGSNFEHGFEDQLGRIFASEAVNLGKHVLQGVVHPYRRTDYRGPHHRYVRYASHHGHGSHYWESRRRHHRPRHDHWRVRGQDRHRGHPRREHRHDAHCRSRHAY